MRLATRVIFQPAGNRNSLLQLSNHLLQWERSFSIHFSSSAAIVAVRQMVLRMFRLSIFLQIRNDLMSNPIAEGIKVFVGGILAKSEPMLSHVIVDLFPPDVEKRSHDG